MTSNNTFLVLIVLHLDEPHNLLGDGHSAETGSPGLKRMDKNKKYHLLAGVLDPSRPETHAPLASAAFTSTTIDTYNDIIDRVERINHLYYGETGDGGFLAGRELFNETAKEKILQEIEDIGQKIFSILLNSDAAQLCDWIKKLVPEEEGKKQQKTVSTSEVLPRNHVTIITNDFNIPWYWMKVYRKATLLCENCCLGMLQLGMETKPPRPPGKSLSGRYGALLINGSSDMPFAKEELEGIQRKLEDGPTRGTMSRFQVVARVVSDTNELSTVMQDYLPQEIRKDFRIFHFTGHYDGEKLQLGPWGHREEIKKTVIADFILGSILVLDGCNSKKGLKAWTSVKGATNDLINRGAHGCIVTVLPIKHDPFVSEVFWGAFYHALRHEDENTVGLALLKARTALKKYFAGLGPRNPTPLLYQLIGNPSVSLFADESSDGEAEGASSDE
jgi:hypothetical protein